MTRDTMFVDWGFSIFMMIFLPKLIYKFHAIPIKFKHDSLKKLTTWFKFILKIKGSRIARTILKMEENAEGVILPNLETYYKATNQDCVKLA